MSCRGEEKNWKYQAINAGDQGMVEKRLTKISAGLFVVGGVADNLFLQHFIHFCYNIRNTEKIGVETGPFPFRKNQV
jgi:hypothetical protein